MRAIFCAAIGAILLWGCGGEKNKKTEPEQPVRIVKVPEFNGDSAYAIVKHQIDFGPRIPNTPPHNQAGDYLIAELKRLKAVVTVQEFDATTYDGHHVRLRNIIGTFNPEKQKRILLAAHWDTRPFADKDESKKDPTFEGANDGASGVGILLEIARHVSAEPPSAGIDIILFDGEDWGQKDNESRTKPPGDLDSWWCLGSQYWSKHKHKPNYSAYYAILLDMVGAKDSHFFREGTSLEYAPKILDKVWNTAERLGFSNVFVKQNAGAIEDDHVYVNKDARIPMIDIVHYDPRVGYFGDYHHTRKDNLGLISKETLDIVGTVLMNVIYYEE